MGLLLCAELAGFVAAHLLTYRRYGTEAAGGKHDTRWNRLTPAFLWIIDRLQLWRRASSWTLRLHHLYAALHGMRGSMLEAKLGLARTALICYTVAVAFTLLALLAGNRWELVGIGLIAAGMMPLLHMRQLNERLRRRRQRLLLELPDAVSQLLLLINAGETLQQALQSIVERGEARNRPLFRELEIAAGEIRMNVSLYKALDDFQKRCGLQEAAVLVSTLLLNYRRGGDDLVAALRTLSRELWEKRKSLARTLGEEASAKLVFPMVLVFVVVLIVIASPAVMMMSAN
jgi:tight adherence protein C